MSAAPTGLVLHDVSVRYGSTVALDQFSLDVGKGEIVAVLGPSGCGKSTLLRAIAGLEPLSAGRITLDGRDLDRVPTHRRGLGLMFQDHGLFTHLDVADNIAYGLKTAGQSKSDRHTRVVELLELIGLPGFENRRTNQLSGGEAQRVALARALAPKPGLLMLDEPLGSLDRALRDQLTGDLRRLLTEVGQSALHVTHDQAEAFAIADRVVVVSAGRPVAVGTPAEVWAKPGNRFVAEFLGHPNIWSVVVDDNGVVTWDGEVLGALESGAALRPGANQLVVMPSAGLSISGAGLSKSRTVDGQRPGLIEAEIVETVFRHGAFDVAAARLDGTGTIHLVVNEPVQVGQQIAVAVDPAALQPLADD